MEAVGGEKKKGGGEGSVQGTYSETNILLFLGYG